MPYLPTTRRRMHRRGPDRDLEAEQLLSCSYMVYDSTVNSIIDRPLLCRHTIGSARRSRASKSCYTKGIWAINHGTKQRAHSRPAASSITRVSRQVSACLRRRFVRPSCPLLLPPQPVHSAHPTGTRSIHPLVQEIEELVLEDRVPVFEQLLNVYVAVPPFL